MHSPACTTPRNNGYSYREGLTMMAASAVGIDPYLAAEAGEDPKNALNLLRKALKTEDQQVRAELLSDAQNELRYVDAAQHPELVNAISAKILAAQGQGGDSEIAHVTPGEMVLHPDQLSPRTRAMILADLASQGVTPATRTVGTGGRRNPATGAAQFSVAGGCDPGLGECINDRLIPDGYKPGPPPPGVPNYTFTYDRGGNPANPGPAPVGVSAGNRTPPRYGGGGFLIGSARADDGPDRQTPEVENRKPRLRLPGFYDPCDHGMMAPSCEGWVAGYLKDKPWNYMPTAADLAMLPDAQKKRLAEYYDGWANMSRGLEVWSPALGRVVHRAVGWLAKGTGNAGNATFEEIAQAYRDSIRTQDP